MSTQNEIEVRKAIREITERFTHKRLQLGYELEQVRISTIQLIVSYDTYGRNKGELRNVTWNVHYYINDTSHTIQSELLDTIIDEIFRRLEYDRSTKFLMIDAAPIEAAPIEEGHPEF